MTRSGPAACRPSRTPQRYQSWNQQHSRWVLLPVLGLVVLAVPGLIVLGVISTNIGSGAVLVGAMAAVLPVILVVAAFLWVDRWEPEPSRLLLAAFLWGAGVSVLGAAIVNDTAAVLGEQVLGNGRGDLVGTVISAPIAEEAFKGAFLIGLVLLRRREFDGVVDGIVYAGLVAAGFAFTENVLYFGRAFATDGLVGEGGSVVVVFMIRGVLSPFAHPVFTAMIGVAVGLAVRRRNLFGWVLVPLVGYVPAVVLHALWNASAGLGFFPGFYAVIMVPLFGGLIALVLWQRRREQRVVAGQLAGFASAGWIAPTEVPLLASLAGRRGWRSEVRRRAGERAADAVRDYQHAVTELAFLSDRMQRGTVGSETGRWHHDTLVALMAARERAVHAPEAPPSAPMLVPPASSSLCSVGEAAHLDRREPLQQG
ncbi:MAG: PrsW family intramembrane metalloprotease [Actinomycetota bacterium]|nr:PrsW family intramembrane metalloprotease [Actinomycetota bacterium]